MPSTAHNESPLLEVQDLKMHFPVRKGVLRRTVGVVKAVDGVSFSLKQGETLGLVGESGCGKTTTGRCILRVYEPTGGEIRFRRADGNVVDLTDLGRDELRPYRTDVRMIFQDPYSSLNPRMNVLDIVAEPLRVNKVARGTELEDRVATLLRRVGLRPEYMRRYPHTFSGGQRQRIGIARALALNPRLVVADEPVSALDVSVSAQILNLLQDLQAEFQLTYVFISHDLRVVQYLSDRVAVMYLGEIVEQARTEDIFARPRHPYTEALLSAIPKPDPRLRMKRVTLRGEVADPAHPPSGCRFHPRCPYAQPRCTVDHPRLREVAPGRFAACHFSEDLRLRGVSPSKEG